MKRLVSFFVLLFIMSASYSTPTTLVIGDIAFTSYNSVGAATDEFSFIVLRVGGIGSGTTIRFTDCGWYALPATACGTDQFNANNGTTETEILWTAAADYAYGTQIKIIGLASEVYPGGANAGTVTGVALNLSSVGDQIFAFQGTRASHTMLAGIHMNYDPGFTNTSNWDDYGGPGDPPPPEGSNRPSCLINGTYALMITNSAGTAEVDNARLKSSVVITGVRATDLANINNQANWDKADLTPLILPVTFTSIRASEKNNGIQIEWNVGTEESLSKYIVERSADGRSFGEIGMVPATGNSRYVLQDVQPLTGNNFYRIHAVDNDGRSNYSLVVKISLSKDYKGITIYPTIVAGRQFNLQVNNLAAGDYNLSIVGADGSVASRKIISHTGSSSTQTITMPEVSTGIYIVKLDGATDHYSVRILVQ